MPATVPSTDQALLDRFARDGDEQAFAAIVQRYADSVYATCLRVLHNRAKAQDAAQETFFRLVRNPAAVEHSLGGWLHRVATTQSIDVLRGDRSRRQRELAHAREVGSSDEVSSWQELSPHVDAALADLPDEQRWLLVQHYLRGRSLASLTAEAGVSTPTLSRRHRAALDALRRQLRKRGVVTGLTALVAMLTHGTAAAAPPTLAAELGKMTMLSGSAGSGLAGGKVAAWLTTALLAIILTGAATSALLGWRQMPPPTTTAKASESAAPAPPPAAEHEAAARLRYVVLPGPDDFDGRMIAMVQDPASATDEQLAVVYRDNRTVTLSTAEAQRRVLEQTGRTLANLAAQQNVP